MPRFLLLLYRPSAAASGSSPEDLRERLARHRAWREEMIRAGKMLAGEKLTDDGGFWLRRSGRDVLAEAAHGAGRNVISGYFLIQADDDREAKEVAGRCPHLEDGGTIELRRIEPT